MPQSQRLLGVLRVPPRDAVCARQCSSTRKKDSNKKSCYKEKGKDAKDPSKNCEPLMAEVGHYRPVSVKEPKNSGDDRSENNGYRKRQ
jgi:hypothetical protein